MGLVLITPPVTEPISVAAAKLHLRVDGEEEDILISALIQAAREHVENMTGRALLTQTWQYQSDSFSPYGAIRLGRAPLQSVTFVKYYNVAGVLTTVVSTDYFADVSLTTGELTLAYGAYWPTPRSQRNAVTIEFVAGYGNDPALVPKPLIAAMYLLIGHLYATRESFVTGANIMENPTMDALLHPYVVTLVA